METLSDRSLVIYPGAKVTVVVPTYNRGESLRATIEALLKSNTGQLELLAIIVVDDGSKESAVSIVDSYSVDFPFTLRCIRQVNAGPASARNTGFRKSEGNIVIFIDDDIIVGPDLVRQHVLAHQTHPSTVIFGPSVVDKMGAAAPIFPYLVSLSYGTAPCGDAHEFLSVDIPASGHISVDAGMFDQVKAVYSDNLVTPGAEEFELAYRLRQSGIPILLALRLVALHHQPLSLRDLCRQQYKHALGTAEVMIRYPATREMPALSRIAEANFGLSPGMGVRAAKRATLKRVVAMAPFRTAGRLLVQVIECLAPFRRILTPLYRVIVSAYYYAGLRDGRRRSWS